MITKLENTHSYLLGCCEGAIKGALIDLKYGHVETAVKILEDAIARVNAADAEREIESRESETRWNPTDENLLRAARKVRKTCEHDWQQDPKCDLVDICSKCGEERA